MSRKTVLILTRGLRLRPVYRKMAEELGRDHRVVVLVTHQEVPEFSSIPGVEVRCYRTPDIATVQSEGWMGTDEEIKTKVLRIEREIGLPLYKAASNFLLYGRMVKEFGGRWTYLRTERDILRSYVGAYEELSKIFDEFQPDVVHYEVIDRITNLVAFVLAYQRGIFALDFQASTLIDGKGSFRFGLWRKNVLLEHLYAQKDPILPESYTAADQILALGLYESGYMKRTRQLVQVNSPFKRILQLTARGALEKARRNFRLHVRSICNRWWLESHLSRQVPDQPYLLFYLQHVPEARLCAESPRWVNQDALIEQLAINAPSGLKIVVKEHPRTYGHRGARFFRPLKDLPNIVLCHPEVDSYQLVSGAEAIVTVTGSVGLEGLVLGKRVGVLGRPFYCVYEGVRRLDFPEDIFTQMRDPTWKPEETAQERRDFLAAYLQSLLEFGTGLTTSLNEVGDGAVWGRAMRRMLELIDRYGLRPEQFETGLEECAVNIERVAA